LNKKPSVYFQDLGSKAYSEAWEYQTELQQEVIHRKRFLPEEAQKHYLLFCEHNPVYTLGKSGTKDHLLIDVAQQKDFEFFKINRGGDITYHGPGQLTVYPILDMDEFFTDIHKYVRLLEEIVIQTLSHFNIRSKRIDGYTGVWIDVAPGMVERKICAIGVHLSRWVTMHGLALNVNTDLSHFSNIVPCGIAEEGKTVTSIEKELGHVVSMDEVKELLKEKFVGYFKCELIQ